MSDSIDDYEDIPPEDMTLYFSDLCMLREEGEMNMMSAPRWLVLDTSYGKIKLV